MANRKRHAVDSAPPGRWALLGGLLAAWRTIELGYDTQTGFARECLPLTASGNPNVRLVADVENNRRPGTYPEPKLKLIAHWYRVSYRSVLAVLHGEADELAPAEPAVVAGAGDAPMTDPARRAADREYALVIFERLAVLSSQGAADPSGAQVFGAGSPYARVWDDMRTWPGLEYPRDLVWVLADVQRRAAARRAAGNPGSGTDGALVRACAAGERSHPRARALIGRNRLRTPRQWHMTNTGIVTS